MNLTAVMIYLMNVFNLDQFSCVCCQLLVLSDSLSLSVLTGFVSERTEKLRGDELVGQIKEEKEEGFT